MSGGVIDEVDVTEVQNDIQVGDIFVRSHDLVDAVADVRRRRERPTMI